MRNNFWLMVLLICAASLQFSCRESRVIASAGYTKNEKTLDSIYQLYNKLYAQTPFSIEFNNKAFDDLSITIATDSIKYIYRFNITEKRLNDTLLKYSIDTAGTRQLINLMRPVHCTWITNLVYYESGTAKELTNISIRCLAPVFPYTTSMYFILACFKEPQYYDSKGRLLAGKQIQKLREINNQVFHRINDRIAYTVYEKFR